MAKRAALFAPSPPAVREFLPPSFADYRARCLLNPAGLAPQNIRTFLPLFHSAVIVMPLREQLDGALKGLNISKLDLLKLVERRRIQFLLPHSVERYDADLVATALERAPQSLLFSRRLALVTVAEMRRRIPLLFPPITARDRGTILRIAREAVAFSKNDTIKRANLAVVAELERSWSQFETMIHERGAIGVPMVGIGPIIAALSSAFTGKDVFSNAIHGASSVEWAAPLRAVVVPASTPTYSEEAAVTVCASLYSGCSELSAKSLRPDFHAIETALGGLLGIDSDAPVLDLETSFPLEDANRLRAILTDITEKNPGAHHLEQAIESFNDRVRRFEKRADLVKNFEIVGLCAALLVGGRYVEGMENLVPFGAWLGKTLLSSTASGPEWLRTVMDTVKGALWTTSEIVLVSRLRKR